MDWGISSNDIDDFDRSKQYAPYSGPQPPLGVYQFLIKVLRGVPATRDSLPQLRVGLELVPRFKEENQFAGYFLMAFLKIGERNAWTYVPFCDAIEVSGTDFTDRTQLDTDGNVKRIGRWRNTGDTLILAQVKDGTDQAGNPRREIGWMGPVEESATEEEPEEYADEYDGEPAPPRATRSRANTVKSTRSASRIRRPVDDDDEDAF